MDINLVNENDPVLKIKTSVFDFQNNDIDLKILIEKMFTLMDESNGVGLAAPQVGLSLRFFIMFIDNRRYVCFNPEIVNQDDNLTLDQEGCLSFPGLYLKVKRPEKVKVRYQDENGVFTETEFGGLLSRCYQHELDHLNGITFDKIVSKLSLSMASKKRSKYFNARRSK